MPIQFSSVVSHVQLFATPWTAAHQTSLSITNSWSLPKPMSIESVMPSNHLILCRPLLLLPSIFPNIRVFSNESALHIRWPNCPFWTLHRSGIIWHNSFALFCVWFISLCMFSIFIFDIECIRVSLLFIIK